MHSNEDKHFSHHFLQGSHWFLCNENYLDEVANRGSTWSRKRKRKEETEPKSKVNTIVRVYSEDDERELGSEKINMLLEKDWLTVLIGEK